jgi:phage-related tail protein
LAGIAAIGLIALGSAISAAAGKNAFATGVRNFGGGTAIVGERGPELVQLPAGANVVPNGQLNAMQSGGNIVAEYTIRGTDLHTILRRTDSYISRNG